MPLASVRGVVLNYEQIGDQGEWVTLSPGGRRSFEELVPLAKLVAAAGFRVLVHDRRNCGASDVLIDGDEPEYQIWADDLYALMRQLDALPAWIGGSSSGARLALAFAMRYPETVRGLLLWRVTGGSFAVNRLARQYYGDYIEAAQRGGMAAVCATEHFGECIRYRPENRDRLMGMPPARFIEVMANWRDQFTSSLDLPVIGASEDQLRSLRVPTSIVPGNDNTHSQVVGETLHRLLPDSELHVLHPEHMDVDLVPYSDWKHREADMADVFVEFMHRRRLHE